MEISLRCEACNKPSVQDTSMLCAQWAAAYADIDRDSVDSFTCSVQLNCTCGHTTSYKGKLFRHIFRVIFETEFLNAD